MAFDDAARVIRFGVFEAELRSGELRKHGVRLKLQDQPFRVLAMLLERPGEVVAREELRSRLWPADTFVDFDHGLNSAINKLREVLNDSAAVPRFIETLPRRGYRYIGPAPQAATSATAPERPAAAEPVEAALQITTEPAAPAFVRPSRGPTDDLPAAPRARVRLLFALAQVMYLAFYIVALSRLPELRILASSFDPGIGRSAELIAALSAAVAIPIRLYLLAAIAFDYAALGAKFLRLFPALLVLDWLWALAPLLINGQIGHGFAILACAALLYLPFSQRTLVRMAYRP